MAYHNVPGIGKKKMKVVDCHLRKKENPKSIHYSQDELFYHDCDTNGMASRGIIYQEKFGTKVFVGLHLGRVTPLDDEGRVMFGFNGPLSPGRYDITEFKTLELGDGHEYNEMTHAGVHR